MSAPGPAARYLLAGIILFLLLLTFSAPAWLLQAPLARASGGKFTLEQPQGTFWHGQATARIALDSGRAIKLETLSWTFLPLRILAGEAAVRLTLADPDVSGNVTIARTLRATELHDLDLTVAFPPITAAFPQLELLKPGGRLHLTSAQLLLAQHITGEGIASWQDASVSLSPVNPLGQYRAEIKFKDGASALRLISPEGPLRITGSGTWSALDGLRLSGTARADPAAQQRLEPLLRIMGTPQSDGSMRFNLPLGKGP